MTRTIPILPATLFIYLSCCAVHAEDQPADTATNAAPAKDATAHENPAEKTAKPPHKVELVKGKLTLNVPSEWQLVKPRSKIIQHEFAIPAPKKELAAGRMTITVAGGGIEANIARWVGQFQSADGKPLGKDAKRVEVKKVGGLNFHLVDLQGDFQDKPRGPFGPSVNRPGYRMLAAIVPTEKDGTWFIKFYGPQETVTAGKKPFDTIFKELKWQAE